MRGERLPEIREPDAPPEVGAIYREIREATRLPFVNLAWRYMATLPGALPWVWGILGPHYRSGAVARAASALRDTAFELTLETLTIHDLARAGLDEAERRVLAKLLEAYNRGNTQNLIGWSALLYHLSGQTEAPPAESQDADLAAPLPPLPALPKLDDLDPASVAIIERLARRHTSFPAGALPSLYLHLAIWPGLLAPVDARLERAFAGGQLAIATSRLSTIANVEARGLAPRLRSTVAPPTSAARAASTAKLETFTSGAVQDMIVVGVALAHALEQD